jgi:hypothetical protein
MSGLRALAGCAIVLTLACDAGARAVTAFSTHASADAQPAGWKPLAFRSVAASRYVVVREGSDVVLRAEADGSASGLAFRFDETLPASHVLRWRWKGERLPERGDTRLRSTDDAIARVYVTFELPAERLTATERLRDATLRAVYGEAPPHATLLYVWDTTAPAGVSFVNAYADRVRNIVVESGGARLGRWLAYERDVAADYRSTFGGDPPPIRGVAIMTDGDNTKSRAAAWYGDITLTPDPSPASGR